MSAAGREGPDARVGEAEPASAPTEDSGLELVPARLTPHRIAGRAALLGLMGGAFGGLTLTLFSAGAFRQRLRDLPGIAAAAAVWSALLVLAEELARWTPARWRWVPLSGVGVLAPAAMISIVLWFEGLSQGGYAGAWLRLTELAQFLASEPRRALGLELMILVPLVALGALRARHRGVPAWQQLPVGVAAALTGYVLFAAIVPTASIEVAKLRVVIGGSLGAVIGLLLGARLERWLVARLAQRQEEHSPS